MKLKMYVSLSRFGAEHADTNSNSMRNDNAPAGIADNQ